MYSHVVKHILVINVSSLQYIISFPRQGKDLLSMVNSEDSSYKDVANFYLVLLNLKKPDKGETVDVSME